eukprot:8318433-Alexandrium_andersonii.AAC.1
MSASLVGSEMCIRDSPKHRAHPSRGADAGPACPPLLGALRTPGALPAYPLGRPVGPAPGVCQALALRG